MVYRATGCCLVLMIGLLGASAASACEGADCQAASSKPLDIMKFMREQAASTRQVGPGHAKPHVAARTHRSSRKAVASQTEPADGPAMAPGALPAEAAKSFASQPAQDVAVVASDEINAIDLAGSAAPAETTGAASDPGHAAQTTDAGGFNTVDRKAYEGLLRVAAAKRDEQAQAESPAQAEPRPAAAQPTTSWLQWIWASVASTFSALAAAVHHLAG